MTTELYIHCVIASLLGVMFHVSVKIKSLYEDHRRANLKFSVLQYFKDDWIVLIVDVIASLVLVYLVDEWLDVDSRLISKMKSIFFFIGFTGSYVILQILSVAKSRFRKSIDEKTNTADAITGDLNKPTPTIK